MPRPLVVLSKMPYFFILTLKTKGIRDVFVQESTSNGKIKQFCEREGFTVHPQSLEECVSSPQWSSIMIADRGKRRTTRFNAPTSSKVNYVQIPYDESAEMLEERLNQHLATKEPRNPSMARQTGGRDHV